MTTILDQDEACSDARLESVYQMASLGISVPAAHVRAVLEKLAFQETRLDYYRRALEEAEDHIKATELDGKQPTPYARAF